MRVIHRQPDWSASPEQRRAELDTRLHLWLVEPDHIASTLLTGPSASLLSADEVQRWKRYVRPQDQQLFLVAHVLVRTVLSLYGEVEPGEWMFVANEHGRPEIEPAQQASLASGSMLRFNLSHTNGMIALLVHDQIDAGVDVERSGRVDEPLALAPTVFADQELATLQDLNRSELEDRFYRLWTLKESFIKAKGKGLAIPLKDFWFSIDDDEPISMDCKPTVDTNPGVWDFARVGLVGPHFVAVTSAIAGRTLDVFALSASENLF